MNYRNKNKKDIKRNNDAQMAISLALSEPLLEYINKVVDKYNLKSRSAFFQESFQQFISDFGRNMNITLDTTKNKYQSNKTHPKLKIITISLKSEEAKLFSQFAEEMGLSRSDAARMAVYHIMYKLWTENYQFSFENIEPESKKYELKIQIKALKEEEVEP